MLPWQDDVRWSARAWGAKPGTLSLTDDCLTLWAGDKQILTVPAAEWPNIVWPRYGLGANMTIHANGRRYFITFVPSGSSLTEWRNGIHRGTEWEARLRPGYVPSRVTALLLRGFMALMKTLLSLVMLLAGLGLLVDENSAWYYKAFGGMLMLYAAIGMVLWLKPSWFGEKPDA